MTSDAVLERLGRLHPRKIDLSLGRMERLLARLGHPERSLPPTIHVAGTNGKGSTIAYLRAMAEAAGLRVHAYTSPHLVRFHERIRLAGELICEERLAALLDECEAANGSDPITFFEVTTAAAFLAFSRVPADLLLLETGLGGRLDATNVLARPALSVITPVDLDHQEFLGTSLRAIAAEKAGILKPDVPAVIGPQQPPALEAIAERAEVLDAPLILSGRDFFTEAPSGQGFAYRDHEVSWTLPLPALAGPHQVANAATAIAAARLAGLDKPAIEAGLAGARWPARLQRLAAGPLVERAQGAELWLDGGHNPHAGRALAAAWRDGRPLALVSGLLASKDAAGFFAPFPGGTPVFAVDVPGGDASRPAAATAEAARSAGLDAVACAGLDEAVTRARARTGAAGRILICGSLYLAGHVLADHG